ncbi:MFS transporter [Ferruginibacter yonginensis]|uniref:MFS transporter n=1 Tax=Ferruginibacter yonginensis TaxID=1310416 RepID=A0ABV8QP65_9BACT
MNNKIGNYRWTICALVFFATTINYLDRAVISLLKSTLTDEFKWTESDYANIVVAFQVCYAIGFLGAGRLIDTLGTKIGYAVATTMWSIAAIGHGLVTNTFGFFVARGALGVTESGNFPAAVKAIAEWFPKKERAFATGIFNSGANIGAIIAPLTVPFIANKYGWKWAFILTGLVGFIWLIFWFILYEVPKKQKRLSQAEFDFIHSDVDEKQPEPNVDEPKISAMQLLKTRQTWAFAIGKFFTDPVWWFYLFWLPDFLQKQYGLSKTDIAFPLAIAYTLSTVGSVFGGWLPMWFIKKGWPVYKSRKTSMLIFASVIVTVIAAQYLGRINMWYAVLIIGLAMGMHQAWSSNIFTTVSDMFPKSATATVTGIGGMFGAVGGILIAKSAGKLFDYYKSIGDDQTGYLIMFIICGLAYIIAWVIMHLLTPTLKKINI